MSTHTVPRIIYYRIFGVLMVLTALTVWVAFQDFGLLNTVIAVTIAVIKAVLVILFFMHVQYKDNLTKIFAAAGFFWLTILIAFTLCDYLARDWQEVPVGWSETLSVPISHSSEPAHH